MDLKRWIIEQESGVLDTAEKKSAKALSDMFK